MQVFTTCGSAGKRAFLQQTFPWLDDAHIGDSRSTSFEGTILGQVGADAGRSFAGHSGDVRRYMMLCLPGRLHADVFLEEVICILVGGRPGHAHAACPLCIYSTLKQTLHSLCVSTR